jgi:deoxyribose-phosphate aldolase
LKPTTGLEEVAEACKLANEHGIKSVCVSPFYVEAATQFFHNISTVIGFPHGRTTVKYVEADRAIHDGAKELDVVINYGAFLEEEPGLVAAELKNIVRLAHQHNVLVKAIIEASVYAYKIQIEEVCRLCDGCNVDMIKSSTGFFGDPDLAAIEVMLDSGVPVKVSGGIKSYEQVRTYLDMGCVRIGSSKFWELLP